MDKNRQLEKFIPPSLAKVQNRLNITDKLIPQIQEEQLKIDWKEKLDTLKKADKWDELLSASNECIQQLPNWEYGFFRRGTAKYRLEDYKNAIYDLNKAIEIKSDFAPSFETRGIIKRVSGDYIGAIEDFNKSIALDNSSAHCFANRAYTKKELNDFQGALDDYNKAIELDPINAHNLASRAILKEGFEDIKGAIEDMDKAISIENDNRDFYTVRGFYKEKDGDIEGAKEDMIIIEKLESQRKDIWEEKIFPLFNANEWQELLNITNICVSEFPEWDTGFFYRGIAKEKIGDLQGAKEDKLKVKMLQYNQRKNKCILVIEDDEISAYLLSEQLRDEGYSVDTYYGGEYGIKAVERKIYDCILLNLRMPGMQGEEVLEIIKGIYPPSPVIIISGIQDNKKIEECISKGASSYVIKPYNIDELRSEILKVTRFRVL